MKKFISFTGAVLLVIALTFILIAIFTSSAQSEDETFTVWVLCQPDDYINVREKPSRKGIVCGRYDPCEEVITDGKIRNGYLHLVGMGLEATDTWIHKGYISYDEPKVLGGQSALVTCNGRLAARKYIGGKVRKWLKNGDRVRVYYITDEWAVTNRGFVKSQYIELEGY